VARPVFYFDFNSPTHTWRPFGSTAVAIGDELYWGDDHLEEAAGATAGR
jgi:hypothetical protein